MVRSVFDLDGTLVQTRKANLMAYQEVGVVPPDNFHQIPWNRWASKEQHDNKNVILKRTMKEYARRMPLLDVALQTIGAVVLTNASDPALDLLLEMFPELYNLTIYNRLSGAAKAQHILSLYGNDEKGVFYDDCLLTCQLVQQVTGWQVVHVQQMGQE